MRARSPYFIARYDGEIRGSQQGLQRNPSFSVDRRRLEPMTGLLPGPLLVAALAFLSRLDDPKSSEGLAPRTPPGNSAKNEDVHDEMRRAFEDVERSLRKADHLLDRAGAPARARTDGAGEGGAAPIHSLLEKTLEQSKSAISGIDRILELADHPHPAGGT